jgi:secondary thiamine-phosphate synthase enzyme
MMKILLEKLELQTRRSEELIDITDKVEAVVKKSKIKTGAVYIMTMHTSSGILVTEGLECLEKDVLNNLNSLAPESGNYYHNRYLDIDGRVAFNASAHLKSVLSGYFAYFPVENSKLVKGSRQRIYFAEYDGPLARSCCVQIIGE